MAKARYVETDDTQYDDMDLEPTEEHKQVDEQQTDIFQEEIQREEEASWADITPETVYNVNYSN